MVAINLIAGYSDSTSPSRYGLIFFSTFFTRSFFDLRIADNRTAAWNWLNPLSGLISRWWFVWSWHLLYQLSNLPLLSRNNMQPVLYNSLVKTLGVAALLLFTSCSNDEVEEVERKAAKVRNTTWQFNEILSFMWLISRLNNNLRARRWISFYDCSGIYIHTSSKFRIFHFCYWFVWINSAIHPR